MRVPVPLFGSRVCAGFPSPADDHVEEVIDLNELMVRNPPATFYVRAAGVSMIRVGIMDGDILVVDRSETGHHGDIVVACVDGEFNVKTLRIEGVRGARRVWLVPENDDLAAVEIESERDFKIWGVVRGKVSLFGRFQRPGKNR
ncbi:MAG: translesion error-prone DNA polymerase V autoproteolytic subunit [Rhodospirillales bacterium]|nr:translesion error-prone DNA polymerase V autoproteolytic subunit [Acetobacter sp.]